MTVRQRATEHGEILAEHIHKAAIDGARPRNDAVAGDTLAFHAEIGAVMLDVEVEFLEAAFVQQNVETLPRGQLALGVLRGNALLTTTQLCCGAALLHFSDIG